MFDLFSLPAVLFTHAIAAAIIAYFWISGKKAYNEMSDEERAAFKAKYNLKDFD